MTIGDPIGDMITRIRNAQLRSLSNVKIPGSKFRENILKHMEHELEEKINSHKTASINHALVESNKFEIPNLHPSYVYFLLIIHNFLKTGENYEIMLSKFVVAVPNNWLPDYVKILNNGALISNFNQYIKKKYRITQIPVQLPYRKIGSSKMSIKDIFFSIYYLMIVFLKKILGKYNFK